MSYVVNPSGTRHTFSHPSHSIQIILQSPTLKQSLDRLDKAATRRAPGPIKKAVVLVAVCVATTIASEMFLRLMFPAGRFLDKNHDAYWVEGLRERATKGSLQTEPVSYDPILGWKPLLSFTYAQGETTNSRGLRGHKEYSYDRVPEKKRLLVLGDSFTYGLGVGDDETYPAIIEATSSNWEVINLGVNGYGTDQQYLYWSEEGVKYKPDLVLLGYYLPDFHRNNLSCRELPKPRFELSEDSIVLRKATVPHPNEILQQKSRQHLMLVDLGMRVLDRLRASERRDLFEKKAELTSRILRALASSVSNHGAVLFVVMIPDHQFELYRDAAAIEAVIEDTCAQQRVAVLNLTSTLKCPAEVQNVAMYNDNDHWTREAHQIAAARIRPFLLR